MEFKVDENLPVEVADQLRQAGHDTATVREQHIGGTPDANLAALCQREGRILVTLDTDFANIRSYPPEQYPGLIVLALRRQDKPQVLGVVARLLQLFASESPQHHLWIVEEGRVRIRG